MIDQGVVLLRRRDGVGRDLDGPDALLGVAERHHFDIVGAVEKSAGDRLSGKEDVAVEVSTGPDHRQIEIVDEIGLGER